eukprot:superscaffoldBa00000986_g8360
MSSRKSSSSRQDSGDVLPCDPEPHLPSPPTKVIQTNASSTDNTACGLGDVTFKSFICAGGEVEISCPSECAGESIVLLKDQTMNNTCETEDTAISDSMIVQSCNDHIEHPYYNPERRDVSSVDIDAEHLSEIQNISLASGDLDGKQTTQEFKVFQEDCSRENDVTWKSFVCDGGEVVVSDVTRLQDETIPLPKGELGELLQDNSVNSSIVFDCGQLCQAEHADHPYSSSEKCVVPVITHLTTFSETQSDSEKPGLSDVTFKSFNCTGGEIEISDGTKMADETVPLPADQTATSSESRNHGIDPSALAGDDDDNDHLDHPYCNTEKYPATLSGDLPKAQEPCSPHALEEVEPSSLVVPEEQTGRQDGVTFGSFISTQGEGELSGGIQLTEKTSPLLKDQAVICQLQDDNNVPTHITQDHIQDNYEQSNSHVENDEAVLDADPPAAQRDLEKDQRALDQFLMDDSALDGEKSFLAPANVDPRGLWAEHLESPMPRPLFNSTALGFKSQPGAVTEPADNLDVKPCAAPQSEAVKPVLDIPMILDGPLQQQLRQMAEFLILASGKMDPTAISAPISGPVPPPAAPVVTSARATPAESHSICVGTSPVKLVDHSLNTSGQFERKREFSVNDACTLTNPLLWNVPAGSLECLPREELEQRLRSSMIMVEALVQQLAVARANGSPSVGPAPSELREKLVQTDHTELSQTTMYRGLYMEALSQIGDLELDGSSLQNLIQCMQDMRVTMYGEMRSLFEKSKETQTRMMQKVKDVLQQRDNMQTQMEEAFNVKEAALNTMEQLRRNCATEISELQKSVGSQQELLDALKTTYPEQLCTVRGLLRKTTPILMKLNEKAVAALRERDEYIAERDQAVEEREQIEEELNQANLNLQNAREQIGDFNLQVTILTSEMGVLRQKLTERDEERAQLERKVTELSATVSSTLASYTFLEQALGAETTKLQESWKDIQQSKDRAAVLETSLDQSEHRVRELSQALAQSEEQLGQLQELSQSQSTQIQQLQDVCTQLSNVQEMNEFLQMETELVREQVADSEQMLKANLQSLRERNIQCEDLKAELGQLQIENKSLQEQLETTRVRASTTQLELGEKLAQAVTEITLLHHTLRGLTNQLHAALNEEKSEPRRDKESQPVNNVERRHPSSSFIDSIMVALTAEKEEDLKTETPAEPVPSDMAEPQCDTLFSETSAFTRIAAITPKKNLNAAEFEPEEEQSNAAELLADLGSTVTELVSTLKLLQQRKNAQLEELHNTICGLQVEQQAANTRHEAEVSDLKHQLSRFNRLVEKGNQALQQKTQELRKDVVELRRSLQQSQVESQFLREELRKAGGQSAKPAHFMEEKIQLLKEVERLKLSVQEVEQARGKLLERAKRHQIIYQTNQQKSENELLLLNTMINKVRETLLSLPDAVKNCEQLQRLVEYIG